MGSQADDMFKLIEMCDEIRKMPPHDHQEVGFREDCLGCKARENHQMPRGAKRDNTETMARNFMDDRSFVCLQGHEYLYGDDIGDRRREVFERAKGKCELKNSPFCAGFTNWVDGEMHHKQGGLVGRNDDMENLLWACPNCHSWEHRKRTPWSKPEHVDRDDPGTLGP
jgi:hypothetical protein